MCVDQSLRGTEIRAVKIMKRKVQYPQQRKRLCQEVAYLAAVAGHRGLYKSTGMPLVCLTVKKTYGYGRGLL